MKSEMENHLVKINLFYPVTKRVDKSLFAQ